jgi:hypothetical protein
LSDSLVMGFHRYAMKRMRRKFKAMQRDIDGKAVDWRTLYMEGKQADEAQGKTQKKKLKKVKDKNAEKREKEKQKRLVLTSRDLSLRHFVIGIFGHREKEKELIKKKLKATKELKERKKAGNKVSFHVASSLVSLIVADLCRIRSSLHQRMSKLKSSTQNLSQRSRAKASQAARWSLMESLMICLTRNKLAGN